MNYTLHQLQVFLKVSQTKSITKAARELNLSQPAVSIQLKNFQEQFSIPLTETIGRKIYITDFGKEIAAAAENIWNEVQAINYKTFEYHNQLIGRVKISVVSTGKYVMPYFLTGFLKQHPGVDLVLDVTNKEKVISSLEKNQIDLALVSVLPENLQVQKIELMENRLFLVAGKEEHQQSPETGKKIFNEIPLIYREPGSGTRQIMEKFLKDQKISVFKKLELTSNEAVKQAVLAGLGYSIMPLIGIKNEVKTGTLKIIDIPGLPIKSTWSLIWLRNKRFSPVAEAYIRYIEAEKDRIIAEKFE